MNTTYLSFGRFRMFAVLFILSVLKISNLQAQTITTSPLANLQLCACQTINVGYTATGTYGAGNIFTVQLSDAVGNFVGATSIGTLASNALTGVIPCVLPCNTPYGTGYRVRTISSQPVAGGPNNGQDITIKPSPIANITFSTASCVDTLTVSASGGGGGVVPGTKYYINEGEPWPFSTPDNTDAMNTIFGVGNWTNALYSTANAATIFVPGTQFVLMEGGDQLATAMYNFFQANQVLIENWVAAGGRLFMNAAPNVGGDMNWGFGGVVLNYVNPNYQATVMASNPAHPIFFGPQLPVITGPYSGNWFSHGWITGGGTASIIEGNTFVVASEKPWGAGLVFFGSMTNPFFHTPLLEAHNLRANIIDYVAGTGVAPTYTYLWSTGDTTTQIIPTVSGVYTVTVTSNGCSGTATYNYVAPVPPPVTITQSGTLCSGGTITLDAGAGFASYLWDNATTAQTRGITAPGTYYVTVTNFQGCVGSDTITVLPDTAVVADFTFELHLGCENDTIFLTNNSTGATQFNWLFGDGGYSTFQNPVPYVYFNQGNYNITLIAGNPPCFDTMVLPVSINHVLESAFATATPIGNTVDSICLAPTPFTATPLPPVDPTWTHSWTWGDGTPPDNAVITNHIYANPGTYTLMHVVTDTLGCIDTSTHIMFVAPPAYLELSASDSVICVGEQVNFRDSLSDYTQAFWYDFNDGSILNDVHNPSHTWDASGTYIVKLRTTYQFCPDDSLMTTVTVNPYPVVNIGKDTAMCPGVTGSILVSDVNNPSAIYDWSTGQSSNSITVTEPGLYWATTKGECAVTDSIRIIRDCYINIPNAFSPDNDGLNDYFLPRDLLSAGLTSFKMNIYNRWGENIFTTTQVDGRGWDGKYNGVLQPLGVYVYIIDATFSSGVSQTYKGNVTLVR